MRVLSLSLFTLITISRSLFSQNLVSNPSFETFSSCPTAESQIERASPWYSPNGGTADLFSTCATDASEVSVPDNVRGGTQEPLTGDSYSGIRVYADGSDIGTEYLGGELPVALEEGKQYVISFYVVLSEESEFAISELGMYLSSTKLTQIGGVFDKVAPQILNENGFLTSTTQWTKITSCYIATGEEKFMTIGNFNTDANTSTTSIQTTSDRDQDAYYLIEDVSIIETDYEPTLGYDSLVCQIDDHAFTINNQDPLFTIFPNADVSFPVNGNQILDTVLQYPIEITDGNCVFFDTTNFFEQLAIEIDLGLDTNICKSDTIILASSPDGFNLWNTGETTDTILVNKEGEYHVTFTQDLCTTYDTVHVNVLENPEIVFPDSIFLCGGDHVVLNASSEFSSYTWQDDSKDSTFKVTEEGLYSVTIENKCETDTAQAYVGFDLFQNMFFPNVITPNNDDLNDQFEIGGAGNCTLEITVFNRWGNQVYHNKDYTNEWPNTDLNEGTYFYSICNEFFDCQQKGWIQIIR